MGVVEALLIIGGECEGINLWMFRRLDVCDIYLGRACMPLFGRLGVSASQSSP